MSLDSGNEKHGYCVAQDCTLSVSLRAGDNRTNIRGSLNLQPRLDIRWLT